MTQKSQPEPEMAQEALSELQESLDSAHRLVERTRFLLSGDALQDEAGLVIAAETQAAAPSTSETVQNPSGE